MGDSGYEVGQGYVQLTSSARGLQRKVDKDLSEIKAEKAVQLDLDAAKLRAEAAKVKGELARLAAEKANPKVDLDIAAAEAKRAQINARLVELSGKTASPKVDADITRAQQQLGAVDRELQQLAARRANLDVDADIAAAEQKLAAINRRASELESKRVQIETDADTAGARAELGALGRQADSLNGKRATVHVGEAGGGQAATSLLGVAGALGAVAEAGPAAAGAAAVAGGSLLALAQGAAAAMFGLNGISDALSASEAAEKSAAAASATSAGTRSSNAKAVQSAVSALGQAQAQADRAAVTGAQQVGDARRALGQAQSEANRTAVEGARQVQSAEQALADARVTAAQRVDAAERQLGSAQESVRFAQEALTRARRDAAEANEDLQLSLSGIAISERRAVLSQQKAQQALAKGQAEGKSGLELTELQLNVDEATQNLAEVRERYGDLREQQAAFARTGIDGTDGVTAAQRRLIDAQRGAQDAQRALSEAQASGARDVRAAQAALADTQRQASQDNLDAQARVAQAAEALGRAQQQAGWAQQDAARGVADAQRALADAYQTTGASGSAALGQLNHAMSELSPAGRSLVTFLTGPWKKAWQDTSHEIAEQMLPGVQSGLQRLLALQPTLSSGLASTGAVLGDLANQGGAMMASGPFRAEFATIMASNNRVLWDLGQAGLAVFQALTDVWAAAGPVVERFSGLARNGAQAFESWVLGAQQSGALARGMQTAGDVVLWLGGLLTDVAGNVLTVAGNLAPLGYVVLETVRYVSDLVAGLTNLAGPVGTSVVVALGAAALGASRLGTAMKGMAIAQGAAGLSGFARVAGTLLAPNVLYASRAFTGFHMAATAVGASSARAVYGLTGSAAAATKTAGAVGGAAAVAGRFASALPLIGVVAVGAALAIEGMTTSFEEANAAMLQGGAPRAQMLAGLQAQSQHIADLRSRYGGVIASIEEWHDANIRGMPTLEAYNAEEEKRRASLTQLQRAQEDVTVAQGNYDNAVRVFGQNSPQAVSALSQLRDRSRDVEIAQRAVRDKTDLATAAMNYQRDQILGTLDADLRKRQALQQLSEDQKRYADAVRAHGPASAEAQAAGLQLEQTQVRVAQAAREGKNGNIEYARSIGDMVTKTKGELSPSLQGLVQSLNRADLAAAGATVKFNQAGQAVAEFPGGKTVVLDANTAPALFGIDGVVARLATIPPGKSINVGVIDLPAQQALQAIGFTVTTLPDGTVDVKANDLAARTTLQALVLFGNAQVTDPSIAANPARFDATLLAKMNEARAAVGLPMLSARDAEFMRILEQAKGHAFRQFGVPGIGGDPNRRPGGFNPVLDNTITQANKRWAHINIGARTEQVFQDLKKAVDNLPGIKPGTNPIRVPIMVDGRPLGVPGRALGGLVEGYAGGGRVQAFPTGGRVRGAGTATSDSIPAALSNGEYVIRAAAVKRIGVPALDAINHLRDGGLAAPLRLAAGGAATPSGVPAAAAPVDLAVDTAAAAGAAASTEAMAGSLGAAAVAAGMLNPALAALALTQSTLLVPAQQAVTLGQQAMAAAVWTTLAPALGLYQQKIGTDAPLANQALQAAQLGTRLSSDLTAFNTGANSTLMTSAITAMSLAAQLQHQGLRTGQFATRVDTDQTRLNAQLNHQAMSLSTLGMSTQAQFQHQLLRAGQLATQQHTTLTAQNTAANNANMVATTQSMSATNQMHLANLRGGQAVTQQATTAFADAYRAQMGRTIPDSGNPIKWVINFPIRSLTDAWNHLDAQFALGKRVAPYVPNFASGGVMPGYTPGHDNQYAHVSGGEAIMRPEWTRVVGADYVHAANAAARRGGQAGVQEFLTAAPATRTVAEGRAKLSLMRRFPLDNGGYRDGGVVVGDFAYGGVAPHVAAAGGEIERLFGRMPGGIGGKGSRGNASDHPSGHALDFMTLGNSALGDRVNAHLNANRGRMQVKYLIWKQRIDGRPMEDRGSPTANHFDHVHASFKGGPLGDSGGGAAFDPTPIVEAAFAKAYREIADVPKFFGPSAQVGRDQGTARFAADKVKAKALEKVMAVAGAMGLAPGGTGPVRAQVQAVANRHGFGAGGQWGALDRLIQKESSWNPLAQNRVSTAFGLFQFLNSTWGTVGGRKTSNPGEQAEYGLRYIKGRYRDPVGALGFHNRNNWYDKGGLAVGKGLMTKATKQPERVLSPPETRNYEYLGQLVGASGAVKIEGFDDRDSGTSPLVGTVENHYHGNQDGGDMRDLAHTLRRARVSSGR